MAKQPHSYNTGRIQRAGTAGAQQRRAATAGAAGGSGPPPQSRKKKKRRWPMVVLIVMLVILGVLAGMVAYAYNQVQQVLDPGAPGVVAAEHKTPDEYEGDVVNILIVGIDYEEGRGYAKGLGQTDMILYANYDLKNNRLNLMQIPRDSYVGAVAGSNGKINSLMITGADKDNPINNLVEVVTEQYKLPVDHFVSIDMDGLKTLVDTFGGLYVYVPQTMSYAGSYLEAGWRMLDGNAAEFFVRNRHGEGFERADIDRLDNQRYFYSALFRRFLNLTPADITKLMPFFAYYCNTDITMGDLIGLGIKVLNLKAENVLFCKVPGATATADWQPVPGGTSYYYVDAYGRGTPEEPGVAALLNQYFRTYGEQVAAEELGLPNIPIPTSVSLYPPNLQMMGEIQQEEGGTDIDVEPPTE